MLDFLELFVAEVVQNRIWSELVVPVISFVLGYLLFRAQSREERRREVFKRRLDAYEKCAVYIQEIDNLASDLDVLEAHGLDADVSKQRQDNLVRSGFGLVYSLRQYLPHQFSERFEQFILGASHLPTNIGEIQNEIDNLTEMIGNEVGTYQENWWTWLQKFRSTQLDIKR